ncbi:DUF3043 domain-containing protein [Glycomyces xiaoerkulensis]|uniref:DUF3043 domain-containing protein n=1 Tax=Glycomyces xiaoerkulensis TaxID=2038139 RepID=UPI0012FFD851|nr:DUF3043 domain-containing protein [Glycomyces xiaoerkulensis]
MGKKSAGQIDGPQAPPKADAPAAATEKKGKPTPKRPKQAKPRPPANPPMSYKEKRRQAKQSGTKLSKDQKRQAKADMRRERARIAEGQWKGDPLFDKYHLARDRGPERLLVRDIVDSRRTVAQYFFAITMVLLLATNVVPYAAGILMVAWVAMMVGLAVDSYFLCRKVKRLVNKRFPQTGRKFGGLYWYAVQRSIMFRSMRNPRIRMSYKATEEDLGRVVK